MSWHYEWTTSYWPLGNYDSEKVVDNAREIYDKFMAYGWTPEAACGALGNLAAESGINPGQWQGGFGGYYKKNQGFGLGQWTPWNKVSDYCGSTAQDKMADGDMQIRYLCDTPEQWSTVYLSKSGHSNYYNMDAPYYPSFGAYSGGTSSVADMTKAYAICWERPSASALSASISSRIEYAEYYFSLFGGSSDVYYVTVLVSGNGEAKAVPSYGKEGTVIELKETASEGHEFISWEVVSGDVVIEHDSFTIGDKNVVIRANFTGETPEVKYHNVTVIIKGDGVAIAVPSQAIEGTTITLSVLKSGRSRFKKWSSPDVKIDAPLLEKTSFTMPDKDVTIYAWFKSGLKVWEMLRPAYIQNR